MTNTNPSAALDTTPQPSAADPIDVVAQTSTLNDDDLIRYIESLSPPKPQTQESPVDNVIPFAAPTPAPQAPALGEGGFDSLFAPPAPVPQPAPTFTPEMMQSTIDTAVSKALAEFAAKPAAPLASQFLSPADMGLTPAESEAFGDSIPVIRKVAEAAAAAARSEANAEISALKNRVEQMESSVNSRMTETIGAAYQQQLASAVPDLNQLVSTPEFKAFISDTVPMTGERISSVLSAAHANRDLPKITRIMAEFRSKLGQSPLDGLVQPSGVAASPKLSTPMAAPAPKTLPWTNRLKAAKLFDAGKITKAQFDAVDAEYNAADLQGRIDFSA
jgi:hypothetical protein